MVTTAPQTVPGWHQAVLFWYSYKRPPIPNSGESYYRLDASEALCSVPLLCRPHPESIPNVSHSQFRPRSKTPPKTQYFLNLSVYNINHHPTLGRWV